MAWRVVAGNETKPIKTNLGDTSKPRMNIYMANFIYSLSNYCN